MLIVEVKDNKIEKALKEFKQKFKSTKVIDELRERKEFTKKSVKKRLSKNKAKFKNKKYE